MLFRVENLGPLRESEVDLGKSLIVLTGPNNTGKTYLAWSVYGAHRVYMEPTREKELRHPVFDSWARELLASPDYEIDLRSAFERDNRSVLDAVMSYCSSRLHLCFAAQRALFEHTRLVLTADARHLSLNDYCFAVYSGDHRPRKVIAIFSRSDGSSWFRLRFVSQDAHILEIGTAEQIEHLRSSDSRQDTEAVLANASAANRAEIEASLSETFRDFIVQDLFGLYNAECILFPAERIALNIFAKELALKRTKLVDDLIDADVEGSHKISRNQIRRRAGRYTWPIRDSLAIANDLTALSNDTSAFSDLAEEMERSVLGGRVGVSGYGEMVFAPSSAPDKQLNIHLTASIVKSLASLVFYFRHQARPNDFLIIDEPELNLHPANQRKIARILAKAVRRGFKIMLSTHSDHFLREVSHLIMLSKLSPDEARTMGFDPDASLEPDKVGVYLFDQQTAQPIPVEETGFSVKTIDDEINQLNDDAQRLYSRLFE